MRFTARKRFTKADQEAAEAASQEGKRARKAGRAKAKNKRSKLLALRKSRSLSAGSSKASETDAAEGTKDRQGEITKPSMSASAPVTAASPLPIINERKGDLVTPTRPTVSRTQKQRSWKRRIFRWWREALALVVVLMVVGTAILVINDRDRLASAPEEPWADKVSVSGRVGATPALVVNSPVSVLSPKVTQLEMGPGRTIEADSPLIISMMTYSGETGKVLSQAGRPALSVGKANAEDFDKFLAGAVVGKTEGSRLLFARPVEQGGKRVTELSVVDILYSAASGEAVANPGGPLSVTVNEAGPRLAHAEGDPPADLKVQTLVEGDGQQVHSSDAVLAQYVSARWDDSVVVSSTWSTGIPATIRLDNTMPGVRNALLDQRVGSRLAVTIPPNLAQGDTTLMMVIDILGTEPDTAQ